MRNKITVFRTLALAGVAATLPVLGLSATASATTFHGNFPLTYIQDGAALHSIAMPAAAAESDAVTTGARKFVDNIAQRVIGFLGDASMGKDQKIKQFAKLLNESFDMDTIGRFTLGQYWRVSTKQQREEYLSLYRQMIINVYSSRFQEYQGQRLEVRGARKEGEKDAIVTTFVIPGQGPEIQVDWRVRYKDGRYKVVDVIVEGVSMSVTQRSDFSSVIQRGGGDVQVLLAHLRKQ